MERASAASLGAGGHLKGAPQTPTTTLAALEGREDAAETLGAGHRVELVGVGEPGGRVEVVVRAERDDEDVRLVDARVRRHRPRLRIDRRDRLAQEPNARLREARIGQSHGVGLDASEHHVELRVAEHERVGPVDQRDAGVVAELLGEDRGQLETAEPGAEDQDPLVHRASLSALRSTAARSPPIRRGGRADAARRQSREW